MLLSTLQNDFYKRFGTSANYLYNAQCPMLYTLLGSSEIYGALSLNTAAAPFVSAVGRSLATGAITAAKTTDAKNITLSLGEVFPSKPATGAQLLFNNDIPEGFDSSIPMKVCAVKLLSRIAVGEIDSVQAAAECADNDNIAPYLALFKAKYGYCTLNKRAEASPLPLPLTGYRIVSVYPANSQKVKTGFEIAPEALCLLRAMLPHITLLSELTLTDAENLSRRCNETAEINFLRFFAEENERISRAAKSLKKYRTDTLFEEMKNSCEEMNVLLDTGKMQKALFKTVSSIDCISAYRYFAKGMLFIVPEDMTDYAINSIRHDFFAKHGIKLNFCIS